MLIFKVLFVLLVSLVVYGCPASSDKKASLIYYSIVSSGDSHTCGIENGKLYCWGFGSGGRLGTGNNDSQNTPTQIASDDNLNNWTVVSAGGDYTCGIESAKLYCWGLGAHGRLGTGNNNSQNTPTQIASNNNWTAVSGNSAHTCAIASGKLYCWGFGSGGRLGTGNNNSSNTPIQIGSDNNWTLVSAGGDYTCGIESGNLYCWGNGGNGRLGTGNNNSKNIPTQIGTDDNLNNWTVVSTGGDYTCGIESGNLYCWGLGTGGKLGTGNTSSSNSPTQVVGSDNDLINWTLVSTGKFHTCGIASDNLYCWGLGSNGRLGTGNTSGSNSPIKIER